MMKAASAWTAGVLLVSLIELGACAGPVEEESAAHPEEAKLEQVSGTDVSRITLTDMATRRVGITTTPVSAGQTVPYAAVLYDAQGASWVYVADDRTVFHREAVEVQAIDGATATLSKGPAVGTNVVDVGVAELFGAETGVGH